MTVAPEQHEPEVEAEQAPPEEPAAATAAPQPPEEPLGAGYDAEGVLEHEP